MDFVKVRDMGGNAYTVEAGETTVGEFKADFVDQLWKAGIETVDSSCVGGYSRQIKSFYFSWLLSGSMAHSLDQVLGSSLLDQVVQMQFCGSAVLWIK